MTLLLLDAFSHEDVAKGLAIFW